MKAPLKNTLRPNKDVENKLIFKALNKSTMDLNRRQISIITGLEIPTLCRALYNLVNDTKSIIISRYAPCEITGKTVMHFKLATKEGQNKDA